jgi:hypothetical protein
MKIPADRLESTKTALRHLIDERTSAPWASYGDEDVAQDDQDYEDIDKIKTVFDVYQFLRDQGRRTVFVEYASCLDPLSGFKVTGEEEREGDEEDAFRAYLTQTYGIPKKEFD